MYGGLKKVPMLLTVNNILSMVKLLIEDLDLGSKSMINLVKKQS